jgi:hypothetical protein
LDGAPGELNLIEDIFLSRILIFIVFSVMLIAVTRWAFATREFSGYGLGWLIGIFIIIIVSTVSGDPSVDEVVDAVAQSEDKLSLFEVLIPSFFGLIGGFGLIFLTRNFVNTHRQRAPTIAVFTATIILTMYFLITSDDDASQLIGIFTLAFTIGALSYVVFIGGAMVRGGTGSAAFSSQSADDIPSARSDEMRSRFDRLRRGRDPRDGQ